MGSGIIQPSFSAGEMSPSLYGRVDLARYLTGLKTCRNFIVRQYGGVSNRPGTRFVCEVKNSAFKVRLIPFQFSTVQAYVLEFGSYYMRVIKDGGQVVYPAGHASAGLPVEIATIYSQDDLATLKFTQSADVMTICHPSYPVQQLSRTDHHLWALTAYPNTYGPFNDLNIDNTMTLTSSAVSGSVTITATKDMFSADMVGQMMRIEQSVDAATAKWETTKAINIGDINRAGANYYQATTAATTGTIRPDHLEGTEFDGNPGVSWQYLHSGYGIIRITGYTSAKVVSATVLQRLPDKVVTTATYKWAFESWGGASHYPSTVTYFQQRQCFAGSNTEPQKAWLSKSSGYTDYGRSVPLVDDDCVIFEIKSREVNEIRHMVELSKLVILTSDGEWIVRGNSDNVITPTATVERQGYNGCSHVAPLVINSTILYIQNKGSQIRTLGYVFSEDSYKSNDLTVFASHLFERHTIKEWAFQQIPYSCAWLVRDDGVLLGLTFMPEQEVIGWHRHDTKNGLFESVASIYGDTETDVYFVVNRTFNGTSKRFIEKMEKRNTADIKDAFFVDCGLSYDGRNTTATGLTLSGGTTWGIEEVLTITSSADLFSAGDVGDKLSFDFQGAKIKLTIQTYVDATHVTATTDTTIPAAYRNSAFTDWAFERNVMAGLSHLNGQTVSVLADGNVHASKTVVDGAIMLNFHAAVVHVGLPIEADIETLNLTVSGQTVLDKKKLINKVSLLCESSRGVKCGPDASHLKEHVPAVMNGNVAVSTGMVELNIPAEWGKNGSFVVSQSDPLPLSVLAVIPEVSTGGA